MEEVQNLYAAKGGEGNVPSGRVFGFKNTAASIVYRRLSDDEKAFIQREVERENEEGNPPDVQRR